MAEMLEPEIAAGRRAFSAAQPLLSGGPLAPAVTMTVGWHASTVNPESGSFAVVQQNAGLDDLVGEVVRVDFVGRQVFAYVLDVADVPVQVSLTRRLFLALYRLTVVQLEAKVSVVG